MRVNVDVNLLGELLRSPSGDRSNTPDLANPRLGHKGPQIRQR
jgi:hypothetical protein